jgi:hypothetical protein
MKRSKKNEIILLFFKGAGITVREEQQQKEFPRRSIFLSDSESRISTASIALENVGVKQRLQRIILRCTRRFSLRKPIDTDSKLKLK